MAKPRRKLANTFYPACHLARREGAGRRRHGHHAAGKDVVLDVSPPALGSLTIEGTLSFADTADLALTTEWIMVHGELEIGTEARPHTRKATITLTNNVPDVERRTTGHDTWTRLPPGNAVRPCECASANSSARREIYCVPSEEQRFNRLIRDPASGR